MEKHEHDTIVIHLDDPVSRVTRFTRIAVLVLLLALVTTPYALDLRGTSDVPDAVEAQDQMREQICQPAIELPSALDSLSQFAVPSFMRLCDWFVAPNPVLPSNQAP